MRVVLILLAFALGGCASSAGYRYVASDNGAGDYYYDTVHPQRSGVYYYDIGYAHYPGYHSLFWGLRRHYYDPFFVPALYYGITWYPSTWFGFAFSYHDWLYHHAYAPPWRYSYWDTFRPSPSLHRPVGNHPRRLGLPRYGSARNEAERLAALRGSRPTGHSLDKRESGSLRAPRGRPSPARQSWRADRPSPVTATRGSLPRAVPRAAPLPRSAPPQAAREPVSRGYSPGLPAARAPVAVAPARSPAPDVAAPTHFRLPTRAARELPSTTPSLPGSASPLPRRAAPPAVDRRGSAVAAPRGEPRSTVADRRQQDH